MRNLTFFKSLIGRGDDGGLPQGLVTALDTCIESRKLIDREVEMIEPYLKDARERGDDTEVLKLRYQQDLLRWQLTQAADEAECRWDYIKSIDTEKLREQENDKCRADTLHWFSHWAWTFDPRPDSILAAIPFKLFDFQTDLIKWVEQLCFYLHQDGLVEKSRDMGVTWAILGWITKQWLYRDGFNALVGSRKQEFVDKKGRSDTLLEKVRFLLRMIPAWMLPQGFEMEKHGLWLNIVNPASGAFVAGESSNEDFGRAGRYSVILLDEFPKFMEGGYAAWGACSQSARTKLVVGTAYGKLNKFYELRSKSKIRIKRLHWRDHPWKTDEWYKSEAATMSPALIAQEIDIDYNASQAGIIYTQWDELYSVITWSEFIAFYGEIALDRDGNPRIPDTWNLGCMQDAGWTEESRCATLWCATPGAEDPLNDSVFFYRHFMAPLDSAPDQVADVILEFESKYSEDARMVNRKMSHEQKSVRATYELKGLYFEAWESDYNAGIAQCQNYMLVRDYNEPNPFRGHLGIMGRSRMYVIVPDDQGATTWDSATQKWLVTPAIDDAGFFRMRMEIQMYHIPVSEAGKPIRLQRPMKVCDDFMDAMRQHGTDFFPPSAPAELYALREKALPPHLRTDYISSLPANDRARHLLTRQVVEAEMERDEDDFDGEPHWRHQMWKRQRR